MNGVPIVALVLSTILAGPERETGPERPNIVLILADDHRHDALGFLGHPFLKTPNLDRLAREGIHFKRAVVTTSLCSPSRATILTGLYAHRHGVIDNYHPIRPDLVMFPERLQKAGYQTAFIGKWHMGDSDEPQRGFDHWVGFRGQGQYYPGGRGTSRTVPQTSNAGYNVNGKRRPQQGYITDELTDFALEWLDGCKRGTPFFLYLSHKAVHSDFVPADRHRGRYADAKVTLPKPPDQKTGDRPRWLIDQRNSRHGAGFAYNLPNFDMVAYYRRYCEAILPLDESVGRILDHLERAGMLDNTLVVYMGDNGFQFGEQGLIDKRTAYEASIRIPLLMRWPAGLPMGRSVSEVVANLDIAPTLLAAAGVPVQDTFDGRNALPLARGKMPEMSWREALLYEYFWERNYPQTPTMHAVLADRWKYIRYHGIWDTDELFDLKADPEERENLIARPEHRQTLARLHKKLFELLDETQGGNIPLPPDRGATFPWRKPDGPPGGAFPGRFFVPSEPARVPPFAMGLDRD